MDQYGCPGLSGQLIGQPAMIIMTMGDDDSLDSLVTYLLIRQNGLYPVPIGGVPGIDQSVTSGPLVVIAENIEVGTTIKKETGQYRTGIIHQLGGDFVGISFGLDIGFLGLGFKIGHFLHLGSGKSLYLKRL
jgi:hypothetical protein